MFTIRTLYAHPIQGGHAVIAKTFAKVKLIIIYSKYLGTHKRVQKKSMPKNKSINPYENFNDNNRNTSICIQ